MNFKDVYKAYNDDIKPDPGLLSSVLENAKTEKKTYKPYPALRFAMVAAMLIVVIAFSYRSMSPTVPEKNGQIAMHKRANEADEAIKNQDASFAPAADSAKHGYVANKAVPSSEIQMPQTNDTENTPHHAETESTPDIISDVSEGEIPQPMIARMIGDDFAVYSGGEDVSAPSSAESVQSDGSKLSDATSDENKNY